MLPGATSQEAKGTWKTRSVTKWYSAHKEESIYSRGAQILNSTCKVLKYTEFYIWFMLTKVYFQLCMDNGCPSAPDLGFIMLNVIASGFVRIPPIFYS